MPALEVKTYTGDGNTDRAISASFHPKVAMVHAASTVGVTELTVWRTREMPTNWSQTFTDAGDADYEEGIKSITTTGITIGNNDRVNKNGDQYTATFIGEDADFLATGSFVGDGTDDRDISVSIAPDIVIGQQQLVEGIAAVRIARLWTASIGGDLAAWMASIASTSNGIQGAGASGFQVGTGLNTNTETIYWIAMKRKPGAILDFSYIGNGAADRVITLDDTTIPVGLAWSTGEVGNFGVVRRYYNPADTDFPFQGPETTPAFWITNLGIGSITIGSNIAINQGSILFRAFVIGTGDSGAPDRFTPSGTLSAPSPFENPAASPYAWFKSGLTMLETYRNLKIG